MSLVGVADVGHTILVLTEFTGVDHVRGVYRQLRGAGMGAAKPGAGGESELLVVNERAKASAVFTAQRNYLRQCRLAVF